MRIMVRQIWTIEVDLASLPKIKRRRAANNPGINAVKATHQGIFLFGFMF
jgi:hypothetical protein